MEVIVVSSEQKNTYILDKAQKLADKYNTNIHIFNDMINTFPFSFKHRVNIDDPAAIEELEKISKLQGAEFFQNEVQIYAGYFWMKKYSTEKVQCISIGSQYLNYQDYRKDNCNRQFYFSREIDIYTGVEELLQIILNEILLMSDNDQEILSRFFNLKRYKEYLQSFNKLAIK